MNYTLPLDTSDMNLLKYSLAHSVDHLKEYIKRHKAKEDVSSCQYTIVHCEQLIAKLDVILEQP